MLSSMTQPCVFEKAVDFPQLGQLLTALQNLGKHQLPSTKHPWTCHQLSQMSEACEKSIFIRWKGIFYSSGMLFFPFLLRLSQTFSLILAINAWTQLGQEMLIFGSCKTNTGVQREACFMSSFMKVLISISGGNNVPNIHLKQLNPYFEVGTCVFPECVARVPVSFGGLGVRLCSPSFAFAVASVRNRSQPLAWPP